MTKRRTVALIVAAGSGTRAGGTLPKQFATVAGRPMLMHAVTAMSAHPAIDAVTVVVAEGQLDHAKAVLAAGGVTDATVIVGGSTRRDSVLRGIAALSDLDNVLVHDAARPFLPAEVISAVVAALTNSDAAVPVLPVADTLARGATTLTGRMLGEVVPREAVYRVQTPQGFRIDKLRAAHAAWPAD